MVLATGGTGAATPVPTLVGPKVLEIHWVDEVSGAGEYQLLPVIESVGKLGLNSTRGMRASINSRSSIDTLPVATPLVTVPVTLAIDSVALVVPT